MQQDSIKISDFFDNEFCKFAAYDTLRSLANYVDGLKISARKAIWVTLNTSNFKKIKVSQLASEVAKVTNYIHGEGSMQSVITNLAKNYTGSNNINLLHPDGNFGSRYDEAASAPRYIFVGKEKILDDLFDSNDLKIVEEQWFEGSKIEPRFLIPVLPLLLINGSDGIGTGFKQTVLPRNPKDIISVLFGILEGKEDIPENITPWYRGFTGNIRRTENGWEILGSAHYENDTTIIIDELPIGYDLNSYIDVLEDLKDKGKIKNFTDLSVDDKFKFEIKVLRKDKKLDKEGLIQHFKLIKRVTEIFSCIDENNKIVDFNNEIDILRAFVNIKLKYTEKRRQYLISKSENELRIIKNKLKFIKAIHEDTINIKLSTKEVVSRLEELEFDKIEDSYSYLLDLKIHTLTKDKYEKLKTEAKGIKDQYNKLKTTTAESMFTEDLGKFRGSNFEFLGMES